MSEGVEEETLAELTAKQKRFCQEYVIDFNGAQAAIRTGYSVKTARMIASENLTKPNIKKYVSDLLESKTLGKEGTKKLITDIATASINDYYKTELVPETPRIKQPLAQYIADLEEYIIQEEMFCDKMEYTEAYYDKFHEGLNSTRQRVIRLKIELDRNPNAFRIVDGETVMVERAVLDMEKLVKDKEHGRIKSIKHTQYGVQVELFGADGALTNMARIHGLFNDKVDLTTNGESLNKPITPTDAQAFLDSLKTSNGID